VKTSVSHDPKWQKNNIIDAEMTELLLFNQMLKFQHEQPHCQWAIVIYVFAT
jgi:hypothetical protein